MVKSFDVVSFGSAVIDTFVETEFNRKSKSYSYPAGSKILVHGMDTQIGGGGTNTAVAFSRFGFRTGCVTKIGSGTNGSRILKMLKSEKVVFLGSRCKGGHTGHSIILDSKGSQRTILTSKGCGNSLVFSEIPKFRTNWLYLSSMLGETFRSQVKVALEQKAKGAKVVFNPSEYIIGKMNLTKLLRLVDVLVLNKQEAHALVKKYKKKGDVLKALQSLGPSIVVVTDGRNTAYAYNGIKLYSIKPPRTRVVEATGAGDAFASGFVAGLMTNRSLDDCLRLGLEESKAVLGHFGAKNNLIKRELVKKK